MIGAGFPAAVTVAIESGVVARPIILNAEVVRRGNNDRFGRGPSLVQRIFDLDIAIRTK